jgi:hypothetical protein
MWLLLLFWATVLWRLVVFLLAVWLFVSKLVLIRGLNSISSSVPRELVDRSFVDNLRRRCRITTRYDAKLIAEERSWTLLLYFFFFGVPSDSRVVVNSILSLLGINCCGIIITCRDSMWIPFSITDFLLWTAWLADVDAATRASRTYTVAAGTCRDRKAEGGWKGHDSLSIQHYTTISKISYAYSLRSDESFFLLQGQKNPIITSKKLLWRNLMPRAFHVAHNCVPHFLCVRVCRFSLLEARGRNGCHHLDSNGSS